LNRVSSNRLTIRYGGPTHLSHASRRTCSHGCCVGSNDIDWCGRRSWIGGGRLDLPNCACAVDAAQGAVRTNVQGVIGKIAGIHRHATDRAEGSAKLSGKSHIGNGAYVRDSCYSPQSCGINRVAGKFAGTGDDGVADKSAFRTGNEVTQNQRALILSATFVSVAGSEALVSIGNDVRRDVARAVSVVANPAQSKSMAYARLW